MISPTELVEMKKYLAMLAVGGVPDDTEVGLCSNFLDEFGVEIDQKWFRGYPGFSGDEEYPLLCGKDDYLHRYGLLWIGVRGAERRKFCAWIALNIDETWCEDE